MHVHGYRVDPAPARAHFHTRTRAQSTRLEAMLLFLDCHSALAVCCLFTRHTERLRGQRKPVDLDSWDIVV